MQSTRQQGTAAELAVRSILHARGFRYRVNRAVLPGVRREADLVFQGARVAVFVDGCFWHGCPDHASWPKANADWWRDKLLANRRRDADTDRRFAEAGWHVIRVWEHESPGEAADRIEEGVRERINRARQLRYPSHE
jgi:DNA mismatch endonuclease (patch repair protein)